MVVLKLNQFQRYACTLFLISRCLSLFLCTSANPSWHVRPRMLQMIAWSAPCAPCVPCSASLADGLGKIRRQRMMSADVRTVAMWLDTKFSMRRYWRCRYFSWNWCKQMLCWDIFHLFFGQTWLNHKYCWFSFFFLALHLFLFVQSLLQIFIRL